MRMGDYVAARMFVSELEDIKRNSCKCPYCRKGLVLESTSKKGRSECAHCSCELGWNRTSQGIKTYEVESSSHSRKVKQNADADETFSSCVGALVGLGFLIAVAAQSCSAM